MSSEKKNFSVDIRMMSDRYEKLSDELISLKRAADTLEKRLEVMKAMWSGDAANAFHANISDDIRLIGDFIAASEKARNDHEYALKIYREIEQRAEDISNAISI